MCAFGQGLADRDDETDLMISDERRGGMENLPHHIKWADEKSAADNVWKVARRLFLEKHVMVEERARGVMAGPTNSRRWTHLERHHGNGVVFDTAVSTCAEGRNR